MKRLIIWSLLACLCLAVPIPAGEVVPHGEDFLVRTLEFGAKGTASAMSPDGSFVVAWDAYFCCMAARGYDRDGNTSGLVWDLNPGFPATPDPIDVSALADDDFVVVWETYNEAYEPVIRSRRFALEGTPLGASVDVTDASDGSTNIHPAVDAWPSFSGFLVVWAQEDPADPGTDGLDIQIAAFGTADAPEGHFLVNSYTPGDQDSPALSVGVDSSFVVTWRSVGSPGDDGDGKSIQARWFSPGGTPEGQFQVNTFTVGDQDDADVAVAPDGRFLVAWDGRSAASDLDRSIQGRMYDPDRVPLGPDFQINTTTPEIQSQPAVEARADGSFLVVWRSAGGVFGQVVDADGGLLGSEVEINTTEGEGFSRPTVAGALNERFVVTWDSDDDYYGHDRRARRLRDALFSDGFESGDTTAWSETVP